MGIKDTLENLAEYAKKAGKDSWKAVKNNAKIGVMIGAGVLGSFIADKYMASARGDGPGGALQIDNVFVNDPYLQSTGYCMIFQHTDGLEGIDAHDYEFNKTPPADDRYHDSKIVSIVDGNEISADSRPLNNKGVQVSLGKDSQSSVNASYENLLIFSFPYAGWEFEKKPITASKFFLTDFDDNGKVDLGDFAKMARYWKNKPGNYPADIIGPDGQIKDYEVNELELRKYANSWLKNRDGPVFDIRRAIAKNNGVIQVKPYEPNRPVGVRYNYGPRAYSKWKTRFDRFQTDLTGNEYEDGDGKVDLRDFAEMTKSYGRKSIEAGKLVGDVSGEYGVPDADVDYYDVGAVCSDWCKDIKDANTISSASPFINQTYTIDAGKLQKQLKESQFNRFSNWMKFMGGIEYTPNKTAA